MASYAAELSRITVLDDAGRAVLDDVSVGFAPGVATALVGHNGGGKTTILRLILGLVRPSAGHVVVLGLDLGKASYAELREHRMRTGYAFEAAGLWANRTVYQNIALPLTYHAGASMGPAAVDARVRALADELGITAALELPSYAANASVRKRTLIARALVLEPMLLLSDEAEVGLVRREAELVAAAIARRRAERQMTVIFADHDGKLGPFEVEQRWYVEDGHVLERPSMLPPVDRTTDVRDSIAALGESSAMGRPR